MALSKTGGGATFCLNFFGSRHSGVKPSSRGLLGIFYRNSVLIPTALTVKTKKSVRLSQSVES